MSVAGYKKPASIFFYSLTQLNDITGINPRSSKFINPLLASELDTTGGGI